MFRFWKTVWAEFKNQRIIVFSGVTLALSVYAFFHFSPWRHPGFNGEFTQLAEIITLLVFASCAGSFSSRREESRIPIVRFLVKLCAAAVATLFSAMLVSISLFLSVRWDYSNSILASIYPDFGYIQPSAYCSGAFLIYACTVLFSLLIKRLWFSALIGFTSGVAILCSTAFFWVRLDFETWTKGKLINSAILLSGLLLLVFSWILSGREIPLRSSTRFVLGLFAVLATAFSTSALIFAMRTSSEALELGRPVLSPSGTEVVTNAFGKFDRQVWLLPTSPGAGSRIIKKHAYDAAFSPDGRWIAFCSQKGIFGLRSFHVDLRIAKTDGTQERILLPNFSRWNGSDSEISVRGKAFSPDSKYIALLCDTMIYVVDLEGNIKSQTAVPSMPYRQLLGWHSNKLVVLLMDRGRECIETYDLSQRQFRTVYQATYIPRPFALTAPGVGVRYVLCGNALIDLDKGSELLLSQNLKNASADISADQDRVVYSISAETARPENPSVFIRRLFLKTGQNELCAEFKGRVDRLLISPDGSKTAIELCTARPQCQTAVIDRNTLVRKFSGWGLVGWRDSKSAVLADESIFPKRMALGDIETGEIHQFYP